ncbi:Ig-like domain repeat protein [Nocardioides plantarum]|uniref:Ig-like domain repeat protein n=1 Tax=Nocardioides plantarum TaxID=29299 RepID=UPI00111EE2A7|nr:Ig-like domain repeat protein [Nocardioides plantarum]
MPTSSSGRDHGPVRRRGRRRAAVSASALLLPLLATAGATTLSASAASADEPGAGRAAALGPTELLRWQGDVSSATGNALATGRCDVDGDDRADLVVGAWFWDKAPLTNVGATYVILGADDVHGASLSSPSAAGAVRIDGPAVASATTAFAVGCLGDVNGDGFDDLGISYYVAQKAYVVLGSEDFDGLDLDSLGDRGYVVDGGADAGNLSFSFAPVGDVDDDGLDDFGLAAVVADTRGRDNNGRVWIVAGQDDITDVDLTAPAAGQVLVTIDGALTGERLGAISRAGDVDGDGVDDILLGAYTSTPWGTAVAATGAAYVVFGGGTGTTTREVDLAALGDAGFSVRGPQRQRDRLGISVAAAGDLDGDGLADLLIGADGVGNATTGPRNGGAAVVLGAASPATVYTDPTAAVQVFTCTSDPGTGTCTDPADVRPRGFWIDGAAASDATGYSVAGIGDVDGDEVPDLLLGAYGYDPVDTTGGTLSGAGAAYVVRGRSGTTAVSLANLDPEAGYRIDGIAAGDRFGRQVAGLGDVDGNDADDFAVTADLANRGGAQAGEVLVALDGDLLSRTTLSTDDDTLLPGDSATLTADVTRPAGSTIVPGGTVTFADADGPLPGCTDLALVDGSATCDVTATASGELSVVASYAGQAGLASSASAPVVLTVDRFASTVAVAPVAPTYGTAWRLVADVTGEGPAPDGEVMFTAGGAVLGTAPLVEGRATLGVARTRVTPGRATVVASYSGDGTHATATTSTSVVVARTPSRVVAGLQHARISADRRGVVVVRIVDGVPTTGSLVLTGARQPARTAWASDGVVRFTLPRLRPGTHRLRVTYRGSGLVAPSRSSLVTLVVVR